MGSDMIYIVTYLKRSKPAGSETCRDSIDMAKALAMAAVEKGTADRAEVRDLNKALLFHYPRTFSI